MRLIVKVGGSLLTDQELLHKIVGQLVQLKNKDLEFIIVHGGGKQIKYYLNKLQLQSEFKNGLRVTTPQTMEVVQMVLAGLVNKNIVAAFSKFSIPAVGLCGADGESFIAQKHWDSAGNGTGFDYGQVGEVVQGNPTLINLLISHNFIPVIACVGLGIDGSYYNVNADEMASAVAILCDADRLIFLTDVPGILDSNKKLIPNLNSRQLNELRSNNVVTEGMLPKTRACDRALKEGISKIHIVDGKEIDCLLRLISFEEQIGTTIQ